jgi:hypothetical protein
VAVSRAPRSAKADQSAKDDQSAEAEKLAKDKRSKRVQSICNWLTFLAALGVTALGIFVLLGTQHPSRVAADFTRVGGATRVETALEPRAFKTQRKAGQCQLKHDIAGLSTLKVPDPLIQLPHVPPLHTLAQVIVFTASIEPGHPPDVAVGLVLAAHMAKANQENVSLVVMPHYLESDAALTEKLENWHGLVTGGVVLGQTPTVPEDTRALLRQLLTATDQQGLLSQLQTNLGSAGPLVAALLALLGFGVAVQVTPKIAPQAASIPHQAFEGVKKVSEKTGQLIEKVRQGESMPQSKPIREPIPARAALLAGLEPGTNVAVWLHSQWKVTGQVVGNYDGTVTVLRLQDAELEQQVGQPGQRAGSMLVPVQEIQLIAINVHTPSAASPAQPGTPAGGTST